MSEIQELNSWNFRDTVVKNEGYEQKRLPEATAENMQKLVDKINILIQAVNDLETFKENILNPVDKR